MRSLNIPFIADHVTPAYDPRELALQVVDMIFLRPEIDEEDEEDDGTATEAVEADGVEYENSDPGDSEAESTEGSDDDRSKIIPRLREILFYDDKVAIFKARHMRL